MSDVGIPGSPLEISVSRTPRERRIHLSGELDGAASLGLQSLLDDAEPDERVELDASGLTFVDSMGLRLMVEWHRRLQDVGGQFVICEPSVALERVLPVTQLDQVVRVERSETGDES